MTSNQINDSSRRRKSWFEVRWKLLLVILALIAITVFVLLQSGVFKMAESAADRIAACREAHGLRADTEKKGTAESPVFASCTWPAASGVTQSDGYSEIAVVTTRGPAGSEVSGANLTDTFRPTCGTVELKYKYQRPGMEDVEAPIKATTGSIFHVTGIKYPDNPTTQTWDTGDDEQLSVYAAPDEVKVTRNGYYALFDAKCV